MKIVKDIISIDNIGYIKELSKEQSIDKYLFFDIETLGLSARTSAIYMIGLGYLSCEGKDKYYLNIVQLFAEGLEDERTILDEFSTFIRDFYVLITYNGSTFDIPFISSRMQKYCIDNDISDLEHIDLYKCAIKVKKLLKLDNYQQTSIEKFLGINRNDKCNGGQLIEVFHEYAKSKDESLAALLLLHNHDDIKGLYDILPIYNYSAIKEGLYISNLSHKCKTHNCNNHNSDTCLEFEGETNINLPSLITISDDSFYIIIKENHIAGHINIFEGILYCYLPNFKDYYYLPSEDIIVPKSIGTSIDKNQRENAKKENCRVKFEGQFIPVTNEKKWNALPESTRKNTNLFKENHLSKEAYIRLEDLNDEILEFIIISILNK